MIALLDGTGLIDHFDGAKAISSNNTLSMRVINKIFICDGTAYGNAACR